MATIIEALLVTLGLDGSAYVEGSKKVDEAAKKTRESAERSGKEIETRNKRAAESFRTVANEALGLFAVFLGGKGFLDFARDTTVSLAAMGRQAHISGVAVGDLDLVGKMVSRNGGNAQAAADSFENLAQAMVAAHYSAPSPDLLTFLGRIGGTFDDKQIPLYEKFNAWAQDHQRDAEFIGLKGGYTREMIDEAMKPVAQFRADMAEILAEGIVSPGQVAKSQHVLTNFMDMLHVLQNINRILLAGIDDPLSDIVGTTKKWVISNKEAATYIVAIGEGITGLLGLKAITAVGNKFGWFSGFNELLGAILGGLAKLSTILGLPSLLSGDTPGVGEGYKTDPRGHPLNRWLDELRGWLHGDAAPMPDVVPGQRDTRGRVRAPSMGASVASGLFSHLESLWGLPAGILDSVWATESARGRNMQTSRAGAQGQFQFMPRTAHQYGLRDPNDLAESAGAAAHLLSDLLVRYGGDIRKALAAYNWGPGKPGDPRLDADIAKWGADWWKHLPAETTEYLRRVGRPFIPSSYHDSRSSSRTDVQVHAINVYTNSNKPEEIAKAVRNNLLAAVANSATT